MSEDKDLEERSNERKSHYKNKLENYLSSFNLDFESKDKLFEKFIDNAESIGLGDQLLANGLSSGYNYAPSGEFPVDNSNSVITYSMYAQRIDHLASVLAELEEKIQYFSEENITFGIRASKIRGDYEDPEPFRRSLKMKDGSEETTMESVDLVLIFKPVNAEQAVDITIFLRNNAPQIAGGYIDPDLRATSTPLLEPLLTENNLLTKAVANIYEFDSGSVITLKQSKRFEDDKWKNLDTLLHPKLYEYLVITDKNIKVEP
jgi:hypothetical protein